MEIEQLGKILAEANEAIDNAKNTEQLTEVRNKYLAKKSPLITFMSLLGTLAQEDRKVFGAKINEIRNQITTKLNERLNEIAKKELEAKLTKEAIDISLPGTNHKEGSRNPFHVVIDEIIDIFLGMGFSVAAGPEVEKDLYNFELLNIPKDHPARDMQDTFYIDEETLLRTHTSPVQARTMQANKGEPIRIICPGKTFRRDDDDNTHSHQFAQVEGLVIDKNINIADLKGTLELFAKRMFGEKREIRLRSSFFPFTEPSVEVDISCNCGGKGCPICKGTGYIEILGAGMVHPHVLEMNGYDPKVYSGFAFGIGIERTAMLRYGIDDVRRLYTNDVRFLHQFNRKG